MGSGATASWSLVRDVDAAWMPWRGLRWGQSMKLDSRRVPKRLRPLIPLAERWGLADDFRRALAVEAASREELAALERAVLPAEDALDAWFAGAEAKSRRRSKEQLAFWRMWTVVEPLRAAGARAPAEAREVKSPLDLLGRFLMTNLRDRALWQADILLRGGLKAPSSRRLQRELRRLELGERAVVRRCVRSAIDTAIHDLLFALAEEAGPRGGGISLVVGGQDAATLSREGLQYELFGETGWKARFSVDGEPPEED